MNTILKRSIALIAALTLTIGLAACGEKTTPATTNEPAIEVSSEAETVSTEPTESEAITLKIGATPSPHGEILTFAKPLLAEKGVNIEIIEFTDYVQPNLALSDGSLDANYFQHFPYLEDFNKEHGTDLESAAFIHYEPLGLYPGKSTDFENIAEGAKIGIPNDTSNGARALLLLQKQGLITLKDGGTSESSLLDIETNPKNLEIIDIEAAQLPLQLADLDFAIINGNYALGAGIQATAILTEDESSDAGKYANVIAVQNGHTEDPAIKTLVEVLQGDEVSTYIEETYGAVVKIYKG